MSPVIYCKITVAYFYNYCKYAAILIPALNVSAHVFALCIDFTQFLCWF